MQVWRVPSAGGTATPLTEGGYTAQTEYSPDGQTLTYQRHDGVGFDIYVMPANGGAATRLTSEEDDDVSPRWSPDGSRVAFLSGETDNRALHVVSATDGELTRLTDPTGAVGSYEWLPDGSALVCSLREWRANLWRAEIGTLLEGGTR